MTVQAHFLGGVAQVEMKHKLIHVLPYEAMAPSQDQKLAMITIQLMMMDEARFEMQRRDGAAILTCLLECPFDQKFEEMEFWLGRKFVMTQRQMIMAEIHPVQESQLVGLETFQFNHLCVLNSVETGLKP